MPLRQQIKKITVASRHTYAQFNYKDVCYVYFSYGYVHVYTCSAYNFVRVCVYDPSLSVLCLWYTILCGGGRVCTTVAE